MHKKRLSHLKLHKKQKGMVLVMAIMLLLLISLLTATSIKNSMSTESVVNNVRTVELANQAAEIALRHCEASVINVLKMKNGDPSTYSSTFVESNIIYSDSNSQQWKNKSLWNSNTPDVYVLPLEMVNQQDMFLTYKRPPECMVENLSILLTNLKVVNTSGVETAHDGTIMNNKSIFIITARGFGPEVSAADSARGQPQGSEVWLQSQIELDNEETSIVK